ncbi:hypothetical protein OHA21_43700 [Actinoplanes sp. NBC_00393]|uniref:hypothetical protein n=1 Tax=Actinoplanes sp. NBC_00393 TaxID=2975953 RepID=UPI002E1CACED
MADLQTARADMAAAALARNAVLIDRIATVGHLTAEVLHAQAALPADARNSALVDLAMDVRRALCLAAPGARSVPVVPGRPS